MNVPAQRISTSEVTFMDRGAGSGLAPQNLGEVVRFAEVMAQADIALPKHLRGNPGACMAVAMQALEWEMSPFAVASKSYSVNGMIAYEAQLIAAVVNTRSGIKGRLKYTYEGEDGALQCTVTGTVDGEELTYTSPRLDQITTKNSPLWKTDPQQQLGYFSARSWARRHTPEVMLGVYDRDEAAGMKDVTPVRPSMAQRLEAANQEANQIKEEGFSQSHIETELNSGSAAYDPDEAAGAPTPADTAASPNQEPSDDTSSTVTDEGGDAGWEAPASPPPISKTVADKIDHMVNTVCNWIDDGEIEKNREECKTVFIDSVAKLHGGSPTDDEISALRKIKAAAISVIDGHGSVDDLKAKRDEILA